MSALEQFRRAAKAAGLELPPVIADDGKLHRFQVNGDKRPHSWYIVHPGEPATGAFGCWKRDIRLDWHAKDLDAMTQEERVEYDARIAQFNADLALGLDDYRLQAAQRARDYWNAARPAEVHSYLTATGVRSYGLRAYEGVLIIPAHDADGLIHGLQLVGANASEPHFFAGTQVDGNFYLIGDVQGVVHVHATYVDAAEMREATGEAAAVAFSVDNVPAVAKMLAAKYPHARVLVDRAELHATEEMRRDEAASATPTHHGVDNGECLKAVGIPDAVAEPATPAAQEDQFELNEEGSPNGHDVLKDSGAEVSQLQKIDLWMPLYVADYLAATQRLTTEQHGAYLLLLMDYWRNGAPPDDDVVLSTITRLSLPQWRRARLALERYFQVGGGRWMHKRVEREIAEARKNKHDRHERSMRMHAARWGTRNKSNAGSIASSSPPAMPEACPSPSPSPEEKLLPSPNGEGATNQRPARPTVPDCPHEQIIEVYLEELPDHPRVRVWGERRRRHLRARWHEMAKPNGKSRGYCTVDEGVAWWRRFFAYVAKCPFLTAQVPGRDGRPPFLASLPWLVESENFAKVIEGNYDAAG